MDKVDRKTAVIDYEIKLNDKQLLEYGKKMSNLDEQEDSLASEQRSSAANYKAKVNDLVAERKRLAACVRTGIEKKTGECDVSYNYDKGTVEFYLVETQEMVSSRKMTPEERQLNLFEDK